MSGNVRKCPWKCQQMSANVSKYVMQCLQMSVEMSANVCKCQWKLATLLCPSEAKCAKLFNKFIGIIFASRSRIDWGEPMDVGSFGNANLTIIEDDSDSD